MCVCVCLLINMSVCVALSLRDLQKWICRRRTSQNSRLRDWSRILIADGCAESSVSYSFTQVPPVSQLCCTENIPLSTAPLQSVVFFYLPPSTRTCDSCPGRISFHALLFFSVPRIRPSLPCGPTRDRPRGTPRHSSNTGRSRHSNSSVLIFLVCAPHLTNALSVTHRQTHWAVSVPLV